MGDATHDDVAALPAWLDIVAGYDTGSPDIDWTAADFARFPNSVHVTIDQAFTGAPRYDSNVVDVETGAYSPAQVTNWMNHATAARPTIYVNRGNEWAACVDALASPNFKGDVWLSYPDWQPGQPLPPLPAGCRYVAIQNRLDVSNAYDLSVVLDPSWPEETAMTPYVIPGVPGEWISHEARPNYVTGEVVITGNGTDGTVWMTKFVSGAWTAPVPV